MSFTPYTYAVHQVKCCKHHPYQCLPNVHTILQFGGDLLTIQNGEALITAHHHSYFACQYDEVYELQFWSCFCNVLYITCCYAVLMYYLCLAFSGQKIVQRHSRTNPWDHITIHKQGGSWRSRHLVLYSRLQNQPSQQKYLAAGRPEFDPHLNWNYAQCRSFPLSPYRLLLSRFKLGEYEISL